MYWYSNCKFSERERCTCGKERDVHVGRLGYFVCHDNTCILFIDETLIYNNDTRTLSGKIYLLR